MIQKASKIIENITHSELKLRVLERAQDDRIAS
jgi:hypothetical protein